ncbi:MAG: KTSC domain-containing protein [Opitutales bacterium]|nr:KTSC domain-containing protein [Opitutales bacterium]
MRQPLDWISTPESSSIAAFAYEAEVLALYVRFKNGRTYRYSGVPSFVYEGFAEADSKGAFFNAEVQGNYPYSQI